MKTRKKTVFIIAIAAVLIIAATLIYLNVSKTSDPQQSDFSNLSWTESFDKLYERMSKEYAFTDWKGVNWQKLYDDCHKEIEDAQIKNDFDAYYISFRKFLHEIPDAHVSMTNIKEIDDKYVGSGFGLAAAKIDSGKIVVSWVDENSPAWSQGVRSGAEIIKWDGQPVNDAVNNVSTIFGRVAATKENLECEKLQYLTRAPIGKQVSIEFLNQESTSSQLVTLTAFDDNDQSLKKNYPDSIISDKLRDTLAGADNPDPMPESMVETKILSDNIYYIKILGEFDADLQETGKAPSTLELVQQAIQEAIDKDSKGLILDIRNNLGGLDNMSAKILASFYSEKTFYEYQNEYDFATGKREIKQSNPESSLYIEPAQQHYSGQVIALINQKCVSSGEGLAMGIKNLPNGHTLGYFGTNGSFGLTGSEAKMPGDITIRWPSGQSLDKDKNIQLDSQNGIGGVRPSIKIPLTLDNVMRSANGEDVELEKAIQFLNSKWQ